MALAHALDQVIEGPDPARGDDRDRDRIGHGAGQLEVVTHFGAIPVHGGEQDLAGPKGRHAARPVDGVQVGRFASAMGEDLERAGVRQLGVDRDDDALAAELLRRRAHQFGIFHRRRHDRHLVGAGQQQPADILDTAHAAAHGERHEAGFGRPRHHVEKDIAALVTRGDIEEAELVRAGPVVDGGLLHRISGIAQVDEVDALDDAAILDVEAGNDAGLQHAASPPLATSWNRLAGSMWPS